MISDDFISILFTVENAMRRKDREIKDFDKMLSILDDCDCLRLGMIDDDGTAYIVPLNFGYINDDNNLTIFFHSALDGKKINLIRSQNKVSFEADTKHSLSTGETACAYSYFYRSVMGKGKASIVEDDLKKEQALQIILSHYTDRKDWQFDEKSLERVLVIRLDVSEWSCKEHV